MEPWNFKTKIYSGPQSLKRLELLGDERILIVCDPFLEESTNLDKIKKLLVNNVVYIYSDVVPDPPITHVVKGVEYLKEVSPTVIIAIGGGSAIDMAKGIKYFSQRLFSVEIKNFVAIPTTSGTGSEVTSFAVITDSQSGIKYPLVDDSLLPDEAILTTLFVKSAPMSVTAYSGMDVLVHAMEALVAKGSTPFTDALAEKAIKIVFDYLAVAVHHGENEEARSSMHDASCLAGLAFNKAGLGLTHALAHQLGGQFHIPHGLANAMLLPYVIMYNAANDNKAYQKYIKLSNMLNLYSGEGGAAQLSSLVKAVMSLASDIGCVRTVRDFGVPQSVIEEKIPMMIEAAKNDMTYKENPYSAPDQDLLAILNLVT